MILFPHNIKRILNILTKKNRNNEEYSKQTGKQT